MLCGSCHGDWSVVTDYDADGAPDEIAEFDRHGIRIFLCADFRADSSHFNLIRLQEINVNTLFVKLMPTPFLAPPKPAFRNGTSMVPTCAVLCFGFYLSLS